MTALKAYSSLYTDEFSPPATPDPNLPPGKSFVNLPHILLIVVTPIGSQFSDNYGPAPATGQQMNFWAMWEYMQCMFPRDRFEHLIPTTAATQLGYITTLLKQVGCS